MAALELAKEMLIPFHFIGDTNHGFGRTQCAPTYPLRMYQYFCWYNSVYESCLNIFCYLDNS